MTKIALILGYGAKSELPLDNFKEELIETPYGSPTSAILLGEILGTEVYILHRHGINENIPSYKVNFKANMYALFKLGCKYIFSASVCGSLQEEICPGEFVVFDQFIDLTTQRELSFIDELDQNLLNHSAFHKPFSDEIRDSIIEACVVNGNTVHTKATVLAVDGPRQSTRAESNLFRSWNADLVNTTTTPEAILAHELKIKYGSLSLCTYYDTWRTDIPPATRAEKQDILDLNAGRISAILQTGIQNLDIE